MGVRERILTIRLLEKLRNYPVTAAAPGILRSVSAGLPESDKCLEDFERS